MPSDQLIQYYRYQFQNEENLVDAAQAAAKHGKHPGNISFKRALRTVESFRPTLAGATPETLPEIYEHLLQAIASHEIGDRPGREEPRCVKRRPKPYPRLTQPRNEARTACRARS